PVLHGRSEVVGLDVVARDKLRCQRARQEIAVGASRMARAHVAEAVEHAQAREDAIGGDEIVEEGIQSGHGYDGGRAGWVPSKGVIMHVPSVLRASLASVLLAAFTAAPAAYAVDVMMPPERPFPEDKRAAIDAALGKAVASAKVPGAVVGIWIPGEGSYVAGKGYADWRTKRPMRGTSYFRIGRITKSFTMTRLLKPACRKEAGLANAL